MNKNMSFLNIVLIIILTYLIVTAAVYIFQRKLLYHPYSSPHFSYDDSGEGLNHKFEKIKINVNEEISLNGWFHFKDHKKRRGCSECTPFFLRKIMLNSDKRRVNSA